MSAPDLTGHQVTVLAAEQERLRQVQAEAPFGTWERYDADQRLAEIDALLAASGEGSRPSLAVLPGGSHDRRR